MTDQVHKLGPSVHEEIIISVHTMHEEMRRSMWIEAPVAAAGTVLGCHAVLKVLSTSSSRAPAGVGPGCNTGALVPGSADVLRDLLTDVNFLGNLFVLFTCLLYTSPSPRDKRQSRMPSSA